MRRRCRFKIGDRVRIIGGDYNLGEIGKVVLVPSPKLVDWGENILVKLSKRRSGSHFFRPREVDFASAVDKLATLA